MATKQEQIDEFLNDLDDFVAAKATDAAASCSDSYTGMASWDAKSRMEKSLYKLFDIKVEIGKV